jgi:HD-GYP domain-containing protein (c-di-GMP phosphodiesterase class II)
MISQHESKLQQILDVEKQINNTQAYDILLERLLSAARNLVNADAGSIYVCEKNTLQIKFAQNDTQQAKLKPGEKMPFVFFSFPISPQSISGYTLISQKLLNIPDVYAIPPDMPYSFNRQSDTITGYKTQSMLTLPLIGSNGKVLGVLQMINAKDQNGRIIPFNEDAELYIRHFAVSATTALEKAYLSHIMVMRMIEMARFRDPKETGAHVNRVSGYALEIYDRWAFNHDVPVEQWDHDRDLLKIAATLHDVGKVGIPDIILKKPGKFTDGEYAIVQGHTCIGACLFADESSETDITARDVALRHHERWDGKGYPGNVDWQNYLTGNVVIKGSKGLAGEEIPLSARIVSVADVFDALCSHRVYKESWLVEDALAEIKSHRGTQFDPDVVDAFFEVAPRILKIREAWPDT